MTHMPHSEDARNLARHGAQEARPWLVYAARIGYAAKGVTYTLVGILALLAALGQGGGTTGQKGALAALMEQPFGPILVGIVALGLLCYAVWCFVQAIWDPEREGDDAKGIAKRIARGIVGLIHLALVLWAARAIWGSASAGGGDGGKAESWTAWLMSFPFGQILVATVGLIIAGFGLFQLYKAYAAKLDDELDLTQLDHTNRRAVINVSRFGIAARGVVFAIIGAFLLVAAWRTNPDAAMGFGEALSWLAAQAWGMWLLAATAAGLIAYGIYEFIKARYRRIDV